MMSTNKICNDGASKSNGDGVCEVVDMLQNMSTTDDNKDNEVLLDVCANCGKEANISDMNTCNRCKMVKYCNAACKKKHRSKHKKKCDRRVAELHDEALFKQPPLEREDCPICFLRMPSIYTGWRYKKCCGKVICSGCIHAVQTRDGFVGICPFCRIPKPTSEEEGMKRERKRIDAGDPIAIYNQGCDYRDGTCGVSQDHSKAMQLWHQAAELGFARAYLNIGTAYDCGRMGVEVDKKKANHYYELAAIKGSAVARHNLGCIEGRTGNIERAKKHWMISVKGGDYDSLNNIRCLFKNGFATKDEYTQALQSYQEYLGEIKSEQRDEAAAYDEDYKYY